MITQRTAKLAPIALLLCVATLAIAQRTSAEDAMLDPVAIRTALPLMKELSDKGGESVKRLHEIIEKMSATQDQQELKDLRTALRSTLIDYRATKSGMIDATRSVLKLPKSSLSDRTALEKLQNTELEGIVWNDAFFDKTIRDLSQAIGVPIRLQYNVIQKNQVSMSFAKAPAEMILVTLCNGFDLRYVIHEGEVIIYKKITPIENRFLDYQKRHPEVKLKYWEHEDASGDVSKKGAK